MSTNTALDDAILGLVEYPDGADYHRHRDVKLYLATAKGQSAWVAVRNGSFEVSDTFPAKASEELSDYHREQAYVLAREGVKVDLAEARNRIIGRTAKPGPDPSRTRRNKWAA